MASYKVRPIDSRLIIKIAHEITGLKETTICKRMKILERNYVNRFRTGRDSGKCFWPEQAAWISELILQEKLSLDKLLLEDQPFPFDSSDQKAIEELYQFVAADPAKYDPKIYTKEHLTKQLTFESSAYFYLLQLMKDKLHTFSNAKQHVLKVCRLNGVSLYDIQYIEGLSEDTDSIESLVHYIIRRGKASNGEPLWQEEQSKDKDSPAIASPINIHTVDSANTKNKDEMLLCTYFDLRKKGLTALDISAQLLANDAALYGSDTLGANAGNIYQWAAQIEAAPDNWFFFCNGTDIIGNWSITYLSPQEEASVRRGIFAGDDFSLDSVNYPLTSPDKDVVIYILNISLNDGYQTQKNWDLLWKSFGARLKHLIDSGITIRRIYSDLFRDDHKKIFEKMGFSDLINNVVSGQVYCLDLATTPVEKYDWIMPESVLSSDDSNDLEQSITFRQLSHKEELNKQQLADIAGLIVDTDKYIYPPLLSRRQAKTILPMLFDTNIDSMFSLDNIFCAITKKGRIVGLILHKRGPLKWNADNLIEYAQILGENLPDTVRTVERKYFSCYDETKNDTTAILNCCVNSNYRMRSEIRLGSHMMQAFLEQHPERLELYVLKETPAAMRLYLRTGFKIINTCNGFSIDDRDLPCYFMCRPAKAK